MMSKCDNGIKSINIKCTEEAFYLDHETQMWLCFYCWWDNLTFIQIKLLNMGLVLPIDNRPKELSNGIR